jgi:hypothetical protein
LRNPLEVPYSFVCAKCKEQRNFTSGELTKIQAAGGRWVCTGTVNGEPCAEAYQLRSSGAGGEASA